MRHDRTAKTTSQFHFRSLPFVRSMSTCTNTPQTSRSSKPNETSSSPAHELSNLVIVASIAKTLSSPNPIRSLNNHADSIPISESIILSILRRRSLHPSKRLEFFKWCSLTHKYKHSAYAYSEMLKALCFVPHQHHKDVLEVLELMGRDGFFLDSSIFKMILDGFIRCGRFDSAMEVLDFVEKGLVGVTSLSPSVYSSIVVALVRKDQISIALSIFSKLLDSCLLAADKITGNVVLPDALACNELLVALKKTGKRDDFNRVYNRLRETKQYPLDRYGYNVCIHAFGLWGELDVSLGLFKEMRDKGGLLEPDLCTYNSLIQVLFNLGRVNDALIVWEELKKSSGHEPDAFTYRIMIQGCSKCYRINDAMRIFNEMQYNGIRAETVVYNSLLDGLLKSGKLNEACEFYEKMVNDDGVRSSIWTYNILIDGLYKNRRPDAAYTMFCDLKQKGNNFIDGVSYSIVILHLCRANQLDEAFKLVEEMEARGFVVDLVTITSLLITLYRQGRWDSTEKLMKHIRDGNLVPSVLRWKSSMEASLKNPQSRKRDFTSMFPPSKDITEILNLTEPSSSAHELDRENTKQLIEIETTDDEWSSSPRMNKLADEFTSNKSHSTPTFSLNRAARVTTEGEEESFDTNMVNTYLSIFLAKGKLSLACKLFEIFSDIGLNPVSYTYNSIMSSFVKKGYFKEAWGVLHAMGENLNPIDIATYNVIIQGLGNMGKADLANAVLEKLTKEGGYLDIVMYNTLINALGKAGRFDGASELFQQMKASGINPDVVTYNTLIEVNSKAGRLKDAYKYLTMMLNAGCVPNHVTDTTLEYLEKEIEKRRLHMASITRSSDAKERS